MALKFFHKIFRAIYKLIYMLGIRKDYHQIGRLDYLIRLTKPKSIDDRWRYNDRDAGQFRSNEVLVRTNYADHSIFFHCDPKSVIEGEIIKNGIFDQPVLDIAMDFVQQDSTIVDVGANIGAYTIPLAKVFPTCSIHAFEPNPAVAQRLQRNIFINRLRNVFIHEIGLSDNTGSQTLFAIKHSDQTIYDYGLSSFVETAVKQNAANFIQAKIDTLDNFLSNVEKPISLVKIDVQGFEHKVLMGAVRSIGKYRPCIIFEFETEYFPSLLEASKTKIAIHNLFVKMDYEIYYISLPYGSSMLAPVVWENVTNANLLAVPRNPS